MSFRIQKGLSKFARVKLTNRANHLFVIYWKIFVVIVCRITNLLDFFTACNKCRVFRLSRQDCSGVELSIYKLFLIYFKTKIMRCGHVQI